MPKLATWMRAKDATYFDPILSRYPGLKVWNAREGQIPLEEMDGLLLTGGPDVAKEFLRQPVPDPSILDKDVEPQRDAWEFAAVEHAFARGLPIFAICKGMQLLNVARGGTLKLDIPGHDAPEMRDRDVQPLRTERKAAHRFAKVNSAHHQAIERVADGFEVEAWSAQDEIIEQMRMRDYPFALAVQYHPERSSLYGALFDDFISNLDGRRKAR